MITTERIHAMYRERRDAAGPIWGRLDEIRQAYNGDLVVAVPGLGAGERPAVANLIQSGIDQTGRRIASVMPEVMFPPARATKIAQSAATLKRDVVKGWWHGQDMPKKLGRRARHLIAYAGAPVSVVPGPDGQPMWLLRDPLNTWPDVCPDPDDIVPPNVVFSYKRNRSYLERMFPDQYSLLAKNPNTVTFLCLEYLDKDERVVMCVGDTPTTAGYLDPNTSGGSQLVELVRIPNLTGRALTVVPVRPTLDRAIGQFDGAVGLYQMQAQLMALYILAVQRGTFGETWVYSEDPNRPAQVITNADARSGVVGNIRGGKIINFQPSVGALTPQAINQLEASERMDGAIPAEYGGFGATNVRTGKRGAQVMGATIDYVVQEAQLVLAESLQEENKAAFAVAKAYGKTATFSLYVPRRGEITYVPAKDLDNDVHEVSYAYAGADADALAISLLQKVGAGILSTETAMEIDPTVPDVEAEKQRILIDGLQKAELSGVQADFANPQGPFTPVQRARIMDLVRQGKSLSDAVVAVDQEAQAAQAAAQQGQLPDEQMQPGTAMPGAPGTAQAGAPIPEQGAGPRNLADLMTLTRRPQQRIAQEAMPTAAPVAP